MARWRGRYGRRGRRGRRAVRWQQCSGGEPHLRTGLRTDRSSRTGRPADPSLGVAGDQVPRGVLVLGMHRSGTSAVAGLLHLLGLASCVPDDLITGMAWNPRGHWRAGPLSRLNEQPSATWAIPGGTRHPSGAAPALPLRSPPIESRSRPPRRRSPSTASIHRALVLKDPRTCLTLPYWRRALDRPLATVIVFPPPPRRGHVARVPQQPSRTLRGGALERYNRLLLEHAGGMPALLTSYDDLVGDPVGWSATAGGSWPAWASNPAPVPRTRCGGSWTPSSATATARARSTPRPCRRDPSRRGLGGARGAAAGAGVHRSFEPPALPVEDPEVEAVLRSRWPDRPPGWNEPPWAVADGPGAGRPPA